MGAFSYVARLGREAWPKTIGYSEALQAILSGTFALGGWLAPEYTRTVLRSVNIRYPFLPSAGDQVNAVTLALAALALVYVLRMVFIAPHSIITLQDGQIESESVAKRHHEEREANEDRRNAERIATQAESDRKTRNLHRITEARNRGLAVRLPPQDQQ